jgi:FKBP12-rapamycin complex-associated protein
VVVVYLELPRGTLQESVRDILRMDAATACCRVVIRGEDVPLRRGHTAELVDQVLQGILAVAIADPSMMLRVTVLQMLHSDTRFDHLLCQPHHMRPIFQALNDEVRHITH